MINLFQENTTGKDYICANIHGCFNVLENTMNDVNFDTATDRLFSLGDLINRGDNSGAAIDWLQKPWFHAVLGNHEWMFIEAFERNKQQFNTNTWGRIGGAWAQNLSHEELEGFYVAFCQLPLVMEIELKHGATVAMVHAQLPLNFDWRKLRKALLNQDMAFVSSVLDELLWLKSQANSTGKEVTRIKPVKNIHHVFHGHTIVPNYRTITNRTFMDLGSYSTGKIGFVEPLSFLNLV